MNEIMLTETIANCSSQNLSALINEHRTELTEAHIVQILEKVISAYVVFVVRTLDKHTLLRKEHVRFALKKCPYGHQAELECLLERAY